jgi:hypothetical protein
VIGGMGRGSTAGMVPESPARGLLFVPADFAAGVARGAEVPVGAAPGSAGAVASGGGSVGAGDGLLGNGLEEGASGSCWVDWSCAKTLNDAIKRATMNHHLGFVLMTFMESIRIQLLSNLMRL